MTGAAPIRPGDSGDEVVDLQLRLRTAGYSIEPGETGTYGASTADAVRAFQSDRALRPDGICGRETWAAVVEAGHRLGDRLLYRRQPMLRGDDVAELQHRLNRLGFDAGREDGILGPATERALHEFQRNAGLAADGVMGPETRDALLRLGSLAAGSVAQVRERDHLRDRRSLLGARIYVAVAPELGLLGESATRGIAGAGAEVVTDLSGRDDSDLAAEANRFGAALCLAVRPSVADGPRCTYFANQSFRSEAGFCVARRLDEALTPTLGPPAAPPGGRTYTLLRETRMAAVVCEPVRGGDARAMRTLVANAAELADAFVHGIRRGFEEPFDASDT